MTNTTKDTMRDAWEQAEREARALTWLTTRRGPDADDLRDAPHAFSDYDIEQAAVNAIKDAVLLTMAMGQEQKRKVLTELTANYGDDNGDCPDDLTWPAVAGRMANWTMNENDAWEYRTSVVWRAAKEAARETGNTDAAEFAAEQEDYWSEQEIKALDANPPRLAPNYTPEEKQ